MRTSNYVKESTVRASAKLQGVRISGDVKDKIEREVQRLVNNAIARAKANDRTTLMPRDF